ncbi:MAG TPA: Ni/Fe-hydrogenase, b-type cytochrome subunit [Steroidobacteraceae bacterium]|nr:Ni/Fe-hydrogenase, b-type cytochrome subunit [Steroidobacteraceae bacterium]
MSAVPAAAGAGLEREYVWELPVRLAHWLLFFSILVLAATGYYIGHPFISVPGEARAHFVMGSMRSVHLYASVVFTLSALVRVYWAFAGNAYARWSELVPVSRQRWRSFRQAFLFYTFLSGRSVEYPGHNALAGLTYAGIFAVYFVMMASGFALYTVYASPSSPMQLFGFLIPLFDGLQVARLIHHIGMWVIIVFAVAHVYFPVLYSIIERNGVFDSIFSGYKFREPHGRE